MNHILRAKRFSMPSVCRFYSRKKDAEKESVIPKNVLEKWSTAQHQPNGPIADNKPFKLTLQANRTYSWCLCGKSKSAPICDGTHKFVHYKIKEKPIRFQVEKDGDYWLCNCKQTKHRPFCDGTHKEEFVQEVFVYHHHK